MRILFAGGGSGGHVYPSVAVARRALAEGDEVLFVATPEGLETPVLEKEGLPVAPVPAVKLIRRNALTIGPVMLAGILASRRILRSFRPDVIFSTGGYVGFPALVAGWWEGVPRAIHEPNTVPGRANRILARLADRVILAHDATRELFPARARCVDLGVPIRYRFQPERRKRPDDRRTLTILGGSQGARGLNQAIRAIHDDLARREDLHVVHVTGERDHQLLARDFDAGRHPNIELVPYVDDMEALLYRTDFAISRSGAVAIAEFVEFGVPAIFVPHEPSVGNHQYENARVLVDRGASELVLARDVSPARLLEAIDRFRDPARLEGYRDALAGLRRPGAADRVLSLLKVLAGKARSADLDTEAGGTGLTRTPPFPDHGALVEDRVEHCHE